MKNFKYLHLMHNEKFIGPFIKFIKEHFQFEDHFFIIVGGVSEEVAEIPKYNNILYLGNDYSKKSKFFRLNSIYRNYANDTEKIILHSLSDRYIQFLFLNQKFLAQTYWIMWGYDIYNNRRYNMSIKHNIRLYIKKYVIKKIAYCINGIPEDYEVSKQYYVTQCRYIKCFVYPSNLYKEYDIKPKQHSTINILLGNSADISNNHIEVLEKLIRYKDQDIKIFTPLSYGDAGYAKEVIQKGKELFGNKFVPMTEFLSHKKYLEFLADIDISIFAHKRMQAFGNIITLLGLGKKIYLANNISTALFLKKIGVTIFDIENINISLLNNDEAKQNIKIIKNNFSEKRLFECLNIFLKKE